MSRTRQIVRDGGNGSAETFTIATNQDQSKKRREDVLAME